MRMTDRILETICNQINAMKQVTTLPKGFNEDFVRFIRTIEAINNLDGDATSFQERNLADWQIPSHVAKLLWPAKVVWNPSSRHSCDLLVRDKNCKDDIMGYEEFVNFIETLWNVFRKKATFDTNIHSERKVKSLNDVAEQLVVKDKVCYDGEHKYVPILIAVQVYCDTHYNDDVDSMLTDYFRDWFRNIRE